MSTVILLLGIGSSGKSSVANELHKRLGNSYQIVGFDYAVLNLDQKYWPGGSCELEGFHIVNVKTEHGETPELQTGAIGKAFQEKMIRDIIVLANNGKNLIIDMVTSDQEYHYFMTALSRHKLVKIGLMPPLEIIIMRENNREDRRPGTAKAAYHHFYDNKTFDLVIDTDKTSPSESARLIFERLSKQNIL